MNKKKLHNVRRLLILIGALVAVILLLWLAFGDSMKELMHLILNGDANDIEAYLQQEGEWKGVLSVLILCMLQVYSIFFPSIAIHLAAGVIYGWLKSFLICYVGFVLGNITAFLFVRKLGTNILGLADNLSEKKKKGSEWLKEKMKSTHPGFVVAVANLLPVVPNGIIPYIAAGSTISVKSFTVSLMSTCWIQILLNCLAGSFLIRGQYAFMVFALGLQIAILALVSWKGNALIQRITERNHKKHHQHLTEKD